jgi:hypothetical protein
MLDYGSLDDDDDKPAPIDWPHALAILLLLIGAGLIIWSFVKPSLSSARAAWSQEQADAYQESAIKLHSLAHQAIHAAGSAEERDVETQLEKAQAEYDVLRAQLDTARSRPNRIAWLVRIGGILLMAAGAGVLHLPAHVEARKA